MDLRVIAKLVFTLAATGAGSVAFAQTVNGPAQKETQEAAAPPRSDPRAALADSSASDLPDAPTPASDADAALMPAQESTSIAENSYFIEPNRDPMAFGVSSRDSERIPLSQCPDDKTHARECRPHWRDVIITSSVFNAFQNAGNLYTGYWYRYETVTGKWFQRWFDSDLGWRWGQWSDGNPFLDDYVGHPMMGAITSYMWIQNDPKGMTVDFGNTREYWHSRLVGTLYSAAYSFEWKFGPFGEAGVGHNGDHTTDIVNGLKQNDTGDVELVTTPVGGLTWSIAEDALDHYVVRKFEETPRGPFLLLLVSFLTPAQATANIFRFRPPWYRDGRQVKAHTFWSDPPNPDDSEEMAARATRASRTGKPAKFATPETGFVESTRKAEALPLWPHYGGVHEFGAWWGLSLISGHVWGFAKDIKYMPVDLTYSYLINPGARWSFRYAPEATTLAMLDEPNPIQTTNKERHRERTYGSGVSPVGFRASFFPESRVQPFLSTDGGFIYFADRVLSPQGSQFMYTIDFGGGFTVYRMRRQSVTIGYRYGHLSNANISRHNPGTDTNVFYVAVSRFRTRGYR